MDEQDAGDALRQWAAFERASYYSNAGRPQEALDEADARLAEAPEDVELIKVRAFALWQLGQDDEALTALGLGLAIEPGHAGLHHVTAWVLFDRGDLDGAFHAAVEATRCDPNHPEGHLLIAILLGGNPQRLDEAVAAARQALELAPDEPRVHLTMAELVWPSDVRVTRADRRVAREHVAQALRLDPENATALQLAAELDLRQRRLGTAAARLSQKNELDGAAEPQMMDAVFLRFVLLVTFPALMFLAVMVMLSLKQPLAARGVAIIPFVVLAWGIIRYVRAVPAGRWAHVRGFMRRRWLSAIWAALLVMACALAAIGSWVSPQLTASGCCLYTFVWLPLVDVSRIEA